MVYHLTFFHINKRHGLLEECVESSRKKQKQEHVMFPEECVKRKDKKSKSNVSICWIEFLVGSKLIAWEKYEWKRQLVIEV